MTGHPFSLIPFPAPHIPAIAITGRVSLRDHVLALHCRLAGVTDHILLPPPSPFPGRRDELWKGTCFEFFLAFKDQPGYWEFNMSPSGDWNVYRMDAYRRIGFREETGFFQLPFDIKKDRDGYSLDLTVDLTPLIRPEQELQIGITAVVKTKAEDETYWALSHPGAQADFHLRESFTLAPAKQTHPGEQPVLDG